jgi:hypothetical protein
MTINTNETKPDNIIQDKVDANLIQDKVDTNLAQQTENKQSEEAKEDPNWKAFREARKKDRAEKEAAERRASEKEAEATALKAAMEAAFAKNSFQNQNYQQDNQEEETEDQRIEKKVQAAIIAREQASERARQEREHQEYPQKLVQNYPDFNNTISQENLDYLDYHYPEVSRPLQRLRDGFDKWSDIYLAVKKFVPNSTTAKKEAIKADNNFAKPKSMSSPNITESGQPLSANRISEERRAANWERMQKILKGVS